MPHSTFLDPTPEPRKTPEQKRQLIAAREAEIDERLNAGLQLQSLHALPVYQLPPELWLNILSRLELRAYPSLVAATWHLLRHYGIVPSYSTQQLKTILVEPRRGFFGSVEYAVDRSRDENHGFLDRTFRRLLITKLAPRPEFFRSFTDVNSRLRGGFERLPSELRDNIYNHFDIATNINVALACYRFSNQDIMWMTHEDV